MAEKKQPDLVLFMVTIALVGIGTLMVYNASYAIAGQVYGNPRYFFNRQVVFVIVGLILMLLAMRIRYWKLKKSAVPLLVLSIMGVALVFVPGIGHAAQGASRWLRIGPIQFQPSEFAKLCIIIFLAGRLASAKGSVQGVEEKLPWLVIPIGLVLALVAKEDVGTAVVTGVAALAMIYMAGAKSRHLAAGLGFASVVGFWFVHSKPYRWARVTAFLDPFKYYHGAGYQICQSLIALGSGGIWGVGLCESRQKLGYLPASYTDCVYAVLGQETGLLGSALLAALFVLFAWRGFRIAAATSDPFGKLLAAGIAILIPGQALLNMLVVTSSVPATGVPLPFNSYGGSSLALNLLCVGILLAISRNPGAVAEYERKNSNNRRR